MPKNIVRGLISLVFVTVLLCGLVIAYIWFSGGDGRASAPITSSHLTLQTGDSRILYSIDPEQSEAMFRIDEVLLGNPKTVVGKTNQIAGEILIDFDNPDNSQLSIIRINVRTLTTDNELRNRALRGQILEADQDEFEFAEFTPKEFIDLPTNITNSEVINFQIKGDLSVHGVTHEVMFHTTVTLVTEDRLEGQAETIITYQDFDMTIPEAAGVANVSDEVELKITFVALISKSKL